MQRIIGMRFNPDERSSNFPFLSSAPHDTLKTKKDIYDHWLNVTYF